MCIVTISAYRYSHSSKDWLLFISPQKYLCWINCEFLKWKHPYSRRNKDCQRITKLLLTIRHFEVAPENGSRWLSSALWDCFGGRISNTATNLSLKQCHNALWQPSQFGLPRNLKMGISDANSLTFAAAFVSSQCASKLFRAFFSSKWTGVIYVITGILTTAKRPWERITLFSSDYGEVNSCFCQVMYLKSRIKELVLSWLGSTWFLCSLQILWTILIWEKGQRK